MAQYLNDMAEHDPDRGVSVWLVEAKAVRIENSPWAPLFSTVVEPNQFTATVEQTKSALVLATLEEFWEQFETPSVLEAVQYIVAQWDAAGHRRRLGPNHVVLEATGPSKNGFRTVVTVFSNGSVMVPFGSYAGQNTGIAIDSLTSDQFRKRADALFGFKGSERQARTQPAWLTPDNPRRLLEFSQTVASEYAKALTASPGLPQEVVQAGGQPTATVVNPARANPDLSETPLEPAPVSSA